MFRRMMFGLSPRPAMLEALAAVRERGLKVGIVTNNYKCVARLLSGRAASDALACPSCTRVAQAGEWLGGGPAA